MQASSCSIRLLQPFMRFAANNAALRPIVPATFWDLQSDGRVPLQDAHEMLERGIERFHDDRLGLRLGSQMCFGTAGTFDYVVRSAPTVRDSIMVASRYSRLLSDSFHITFEARRRHAVVRIEDDAGWPDSAADFGMSSLYRLHIAEQIPASQVECWFTYAPPRDLTHHTQAFPGATLRFSSPFYGFVCDSAYADAPMPGGDATLHFLLRGRADAILADLDSVRNLSTLVRRALLQAIPSGDSSAEGVARTLRMSRRTMTRRLERESTTFQAELDRARRELAMQHLKQGRAPLTEIAFLSGFSHVESFHRAFKRWTGQTPLAFRTAPSA